MRRLAIPVLMVVSVLAVLAVATAVATAAETRAPTGAPTTKPAAATRRAAIVLDSATVTGAVQMQFRDTDGIWTQWLPFGALYGWRLPGGDGLKTVEANYLGSDGSLLTTSVQVFLDRKRPKTVGYAMETKRGKRIRLLYKVVDPKPSCGRAKVKIRVYRYGKLKTTFKKVTVVTNRKLKSRSFVCRWAKGWYTYKILATDVAGNRYKTAGVGVLYVK